MIPNCSPSAPIRRISRSLICSLIIKSLIVVYLRQMNFHSGSSLRKHKKTSEYHIHPTINKAFPLTKEAYKSISDRQSPDRAAVRVDTLLCFLLNASINLPHPLSRVNTFLYLLFLSFSSISGLNSFSSFQRLAISSLLSQKPTAKPAK